MTRKEKIRFILRQLNGTADFREQKDFAQWLLKDPENLDLYIEYKKLWDTPFTNHEVFDTTKAQYRIQQTIKKRRIKIGLTVYSKGIAAASILLLMLATFLYHYLDRKNPATPVETTLSYITKHSEPGEQLRVTLPDQSVVMLNACSSIRYPEKFDAQRRRITLLGEAFFEVTKDPDRPFEVTTNDMVTTVLGTTFNIKAFDRKSMTVTVASGKVKVENLNAEHSSKILLLPNQQATYNEREKHFLMEEVNAHDYIAWTDGTIKFNNDPLDEVVKVLERWYNVEIRIGKNAASPIRINGCYKDKKLYRILDGLSYIYHLKYEYINDKTIEINPI